MDMKRWRTRVLGRPEWASVIREAKEKLKCCSAKEEETIKESLFFTRKR
jgi:hypothetical protein